MEAAHGGFMRCLSGWRMAVAGFKARYNVHGHSFLSRCAKIYFGSGFSWG